MLTDWLRQRALGSPEKTSLIAEEQTWNFRTLDAQVDQLVGQLVHSGIDSGQHVAALMPNCSAYVLLVYALARLGAVLVSLNTRLTPDELEDQITQANCSWLVYNANTRATAGGINSPGCQQLIFPDLRKHTNTKSRDKDINTWDLERLQAIVFTSGTSGKPKGAGLTFGNHLWSAVASGFRLGVDPDDRWLITLPFYHVGGLAILFRSLLYGTAMVLQDGFEPQAVLGKIQQQKISLISLVPTMLHRLLELPGASQTLCKLRLILLGGAAAPQRLLEESLAAGLNIALTYGMTETASQFATASPQETRRKPGSVGKALDFCKIRILDETGRTLPKGVIGQISVTGPVVMQGYYGSSPAQGELVTGDLGYLDEDGDLWIMQRRSDLIVSGGENIYPAQVEAVLLEQPEVKAACVVGLEHPEWGQQVAAAVVPKENATLSITALQDFCRQRLAGYKIPRQIIFVDELPQTPSGKVLRRQVAELFQSHEVTHPAQILR